VVDPLEHWLPPFRAPTLPHYSPNGEPAIMDE
jgi:hypothetical protein